MSLFRKRCNHDWNIVATQPYTISERGLFRDEWVETSSEMNIYYLCDACEDDARRTVFGTFTVAQARVVFPKP